MCSDLQAQQLPLDINKINKTFIGSQRNNKDLETPPGQ